MLEAASFYIITMKYTDLRRFMKKLLLAVFFLLFTGVFAADSVYAAPRVQPLEEEIVIVIDAGHGGENQGTLEARPGMEEWRPEKEMALETAKAMYEELCLYDQVTVYMTRTDDRDLTLKERAEFAASVQADFLFSIHYNASLEHTLFGSEVWISAETPYNAYGYQFGTVQLETMEQMGLFLRGIKTRLGDKGKDYYGIIRECSALSVPSVIIEHCHVDEERDVPFCDSKDDLAAFGRADALSAAKYLGLKSTALGVDYSREPEHLPEASAKVRVQSTLKDETPPDVCTLELLTVSYDTGDLSLCVSAADYDSPLLYYDYSLDGGKTYSSLQPWPGSNARTGAYTDTFTLNLQIPSGMMPIVSVRAYNLFDLFTESSVPPVLSVFCYGEEVLPADTNPAQEASRQQEQNTEAFGKTLPGTTTFQPAASKEAVAKKEASFFTFLKICVLFVLLLLITVLLSQYLALRRKRKRRLRQHRKVEGDRRNHRK